MSQSQQQQAYNHQPHIKGHRKITKPDKQVVRFATNQQQQFQKPNNQPEQCQIQQLQQNKNINQNINENQNPTQMQNKSNGILQNKTPSKRNSALMDQQGQSSARLSQPVIKNTSDSQFKSSFTLQQQSSSASVKEEIGLNRQHKLNLLSQLKAFDQQLASSRHSQANQSNLSTMKINPVQQKYQYRSQTAMLQRSAYHSLHSNSNHMPKSHTNAKPNLNNEQQKNDCNTDEFYFPQTSQFNNNIIFSAEQDNNNSNALLQLQFRSEQQSFIQIMEHRRKEQNAIISSIIKELQGRQCGDLRFHSFILNEVTQLSQLRGALQKNFETLHSYTHLSQAAFLARLEKVLLSACHCFKHVGVNVANQILQQNSIIQQMQQTQQMQQSQQTQQTLNTNPSSVQLLQSEAENDIYIQSSTKKHTEEQEQESEQQEHLPTFGGNLTADNSMIQQSQIQQNNQLQQSTSKKQQRRIIAAKQQKIKCEVSFQMKKGSPTEQLVVHVSFPQMGVVQEVLLDESCLGKTTTFEVDIAMVNHLSNSNLNLNSNVKPKTQTQLEEVTCQAQIQPLPQQKVAVQAASGRANTGFGLLFIQQQQKLKIHQQAQNTSKELEIKQKQVLNLNLQTTTNNSNYNENNDKNANQNEMKQTENKHKSNQKKGGQQQEEDIIQKSKNKQANNTIKHEYKWTKMQHMKNDDQDQSDLKHEFLKKTQMKQDSENNKQIDYLAFLKNLGRDNSTKTKNHPFSYINICNLCHEKRLVLTEFLYEVYKCDVPVERESENLTKLTHQILANVGEFDKNICIFMQFIEQISVVFRRALQSCLYALPSHAAFFDKIFKVMVFICELLIQKQQRNLSYLKPYILPPSQDEAEKLQKLQMSKKVKFVNQYVQTDNLQENNTVESLQKEELNQLTNLEDVQPLNSNSNNEFENSEDNQDDNDINNHQDNNLENPIVIKDN